MPILTRPRPVQGILRPVACSLGGGPVPVHGLKVTLRREVVA